jgi:predicted secreted protein
MFSHDAEYLRAAAHQLRTLATGRFDWRDEAARIQVADKRNEQARRQMLVIAQGYDRLAERADNRTESSSPLFVSGV